MREKALKNSLNRQKHLSLTVEVHRNYQDNHTTDTMTIDIRAFYKATNPARTLVAKNSKPKSLY